jgi:hypothetical protein
MRSGLVRTGAGAAAAVVLAIVLATPASADPTSSSSDGVAGATPALDTGSGAGAGSSVDSGDGTTPPPDSTTSPAPAPVPVPGPVPKPGTTPAPGPAKPSLPAADKAPSDSPTQDGLNATVLADQLAAADQIWARLTTANADLASAMKGFDALSSRVNALLEKISVAKDAQALAETQAATARSELTVVRVRLENARAMSRLWAFQSYAEGNQTGQLTNVFEIMGKDPAQAAPSASDLAFITDSRLRSLRELADLEAEQARLTAEADQASAAATAATATLEGAKAELDPLLAKQKADVEALRRTQLDEIAKAGPVAAILLGAQTPEALAAAARLRAALVGATGTAAYTGGRPCSNDSAAYPNGALPASALCPLWQAPGASLRPSAATAFDAMSKEYARQFGTAICVSDSYRTLAEQIAVKASRGKWAATPGTSKHGLGLAVDLCGGIETFGSPQHLWMQLNAPLYGWFHPSWAEPTGPLPEPWHWEFAG